MGRIVISENVSLDGVVQDPTGEEGFRHGGWFAQVTEADRAAWAQAALREVQNAEALLLGRRSYEFFAARWPSRAGPLADRLNSMPKHVVSTTRDDLEWNNATVLGGDAAVAVSDLTHELGGDAVVYASFQLVDLLMQNGLVDEVRLTIYPSALGHGRRLFSELDDTVSLQLIDTTTIGENLAHLTYRPTRR